MTDSTYRPISGDQLFMSDTSTSSSECSTITYLDDNQTTNVGHIHGPSRVSWDADYINLIQPTHPNTDNMDLSRISVCPPSPGMTPIVPERLIDRLDTEPIQNIMTQHVRSLVEDVPNVNPDQNNAVPTPIIRPRAQEVPIMDAPVPQFEAFFRQMAETMANTFKQTMANAAQPVNRHDRLLSAPTFSGLDHEDPEGFIQQTEEYFARQNIREDRDKLAVISDLLRGAAKKWHEPYKNILPSFRAFEERFLENFNSVSRYTRNDGTVRFEADQG